jgi:uncharacterized protein YeaO (DUF488 family)
MIRVRRIYDEPAESDGTRILVDRFWPRGLPREEVRIDLWMKDISPSDGLRCWFRHDPERWDEFCRRYFEELDDKSDAVERLREISDRGRVTLLFAASDESHNNAAALRRYLEERTG